MTSFEINKKYRMVYSNTDKTRMGVVFERNKDSISFFYRDDGRKDALNVKILKDQKGEYVICNTVPGSPRMNSWTDDKILSSEDKPEIKDKPKKRFWNFGKKN